ncbi:hypothetical protein [Pseudoalteromonas spongiae]|uniref:Uncharacterized protein n=1 Tax=Pseudoalteromonas spongiae TaxID=298657 RepID=A0ABU8ESG7_9GAMM
MATLVKRKKPCTKCDSLYNYKCRSCVGCSKKKSKSLYSQSLKSDGKKRNTNRKLAAQAGNKIYESICSICGHDEKYVSSAGCVSCHIKNGKNAYAKKVRFKEHKERLDFHYQIIFNTLMDFDGEVSEWYQWAIKNPDFEKSIVEAIRKKGREDDKRVNAYHALEQAIQNGEKEAEEINALENNPAFTIYLKALQLYERSPSNPKYILNLLEAEFDMHSIVRKKHEEHPNYPKKYFLFNPDDVPEGDNFKFYFELQILKSKLK